MLLDDVGFSIIIATYFIPLVRNTAAGAVGICFMGIGLDKYS
jgi:membrane protein DedA with SNARE-associated domain